MGFWSKVKEFFFGKPAPQERAPPPQEHAPRGGRIQRIRERLRRRPPPPPKPREERQKEVEFKVNIGFYSFSTTYTTTRTMKESENPKDYYSKVLDEAYEWVQENHPSLVSTYGRRGMLRMEIGHEEI